jgi:hypothetical protein
MMTLLIVETFRDNDKFNLIYSICAVINCTTIINNTLDYNGAQLSIKVAKLMNSNFQNIIF